MFKAASHFRDTATHSFNDPELQGKVMVLNDVALPVTLGDVDTKFEEPLAAEGSNLQPVHV